MMMTGPFACFSINIHIHIFTKWWPGVVNWYGFTRAILDGVWFHHNDCQQLMTRCCYGIVMPVFGSVSSSFVSYHSVHLFSQKFKWGPMLAFIVLLFMGACLKVMMIIVIWWWWSYHNIMTTRCCYGSTVVAFGEEQPHSTSTICAQLSPRRI